MRFHPLAGLPRLIGPLAACLVATIITCPGVSQDPNSDRDEIVHVLNRITFGPRPGDVEMVEKMGVHNYIEQQLHPETIDDSAVEQEVAQFVLLQMTPEQLADLYTDEKKQRKENKKEARALQPAASTAATTAAPTAPAAPDQTMTQADPNAAPATTMTAAADDPTVNAKGKVKKHQDVAKTAGADEWKSDAAIEQIEQAKLVRAVDSQRQLQEVLADFWNNHFNIDVKKKLCRVYKITDDRDAIRPHIWGKFRDLLEASAKSPAMLYYLDNATSTAAKNPPPEPETMQAADAKTPAVAMTAAPKKLKKKKEGGINENYAREVMELHTMGVDGGYTQTDVQEVARCFTGWSVDKKTGEFAFHAAQHDNGAKVVLGHQIPAGGGMQDGETVLDILASSPATAHHISLQLCQRFVSDNPPEALVTRIAGVFTQTGGDLRQVTEAILTSPEFLSPANYGNKVKSPFEFAVSAVRASGSAIIPLEAGKKEKKFAATEGDAVRGRPNQTDKITKAATQSLNWRIYEMGEPLFACTPPTGYKETSSVWVSPGALIERLNFAMALTGQQLSDVRFSADKILAGTDADQPNAVLNQCVSTLLQNNVSPGTRKVLDQTALPAPGDSKTVDSSKLIALIIGSPEFQRK